MDIKILSTEQLFAYYPPPMTYGIRITPPFERGHVDPLPQADRYHHFVTYEFDDIVPELARSFQILFSEDLAWRILLDFHRHRKDCSTLVTSCLRGQNRSPAVAMALNEVFALGQDQRVLQRVYPELDKRVYHTLLRVAESYAYSI
jgi:predicted protein tyrosine phosphatase